MKLFKKKQQKGQNEQRESMLKDIGSPAPPSIPSQDPRYSQRQSNPAQDPNSYRQRVQQFEQRYSHQQDPARSSPQQQQNTARYSQQQESYERASYRQSRPHQSAQPRQQAKEYDASPPVRHSVKEYDAPPPVRHSVKEYNAPPPASRQQSPRSAPAPAPARRSAPPAPRESFEPTQAPPSQEKSPPVMAGVDPVVQMERAAVTRELVKQYVADIWNRGDLDLIPKVCARGLRFNGSAGMDRVGHDGFSRMVQTIRGSLEDYHCEIHSMVVEGNKAFCRMRFTGRHIGQLLGYEATGKHVSWMGASEFTVVDGLIVKVWELGDMASLEHQLREAGGTSGAAAEGHC